MSRNKTIFIIEIALVVILFILFSYLVQENLDYLESAIGGPFGMISYVLIVIIGIVFAPISSLPLTFLAANLWGIFISAILSIVGWVVGAMIAFILARKYGVTLIRRVVSLKKLNKIESKIPAEDVFWGIVVMRMVLPVDILSYALGLFSKISFRRYMLATLIGVTPFAFIFSYFGGMSLYVQMIFIAITILISAVYYLARTMER